MTMVIIVPCRWLWSELLEIISRLVRTAEGRYVVVVRTATVVRPAGGK